jgi:hypothetical protein
VAKKNVKEKPEKPVHKRTEGGVRWDDIPHNELREHALASMSGSTERAAADSARGVLRRRLHRLETADHMRYIELECARIVETLRFIRDTYRKYLQPKIRGPLAEMYWVVLRLGVKDWAVMLVRSAAVAYIDACWLKAKDWKALFGVEGPFNDMFGFKDGEKPSEEARLTEEELAKSIAAHLRQDSMDAVMTGGPFGIDAQILLTRTYPGKAFLLQQETFPKAIERRISAWHANEPWTEGLARLFDAAQEEVLFQYEELQNEGRLAESELVNLTALQRIAHRHLIAEGPKDPSIAPTAREKWNLLLGHLDEAGVVLDQELKGNAKNTLVALRQKGRSISTWSDCYSSRSRVQLNDGKPHTLRREVMRFLHNAGKQAEYQLAKVWSRPKVQSSRASVASEAGPALQRGTGPDL